MTNEFGEFDRLLGVQSRDQGSCASMPFHHWKHNVMTAAKASHDEAQPFNDKLQRWFAAGEPIWLAAAGLKHLVKGKRIHDRAEREHKALRGLIRTAIEENEK